MKVSTREQILAVARELFARYGYEKTSTDQVLEKTGVSRGALYHHFENKQALFAAVLEEVEQGLTAAAARLVAGTSDPVEGLRKALTLFLEKAQEPEVRQIILVDAHSVVGWEKWRQIEERYGLGMLKEALRLIAKQRKLALDSVDLYAHVLLASLIEVAFLVSRAEDPAAEIAKGRRVLDLLLDRLLSAGSPEPRAGRKR